jgi:hypothetical protein
MTKEAAAIIQQELKQADENDYLTKYLKTIDSELDNIDKRMRVMMTGVQHHSQAVRDQARTEKDRKVSAAKAQPIRVSSTSVRKISKK